MPKTTCQSIRPRTFDLARSPLQGFNLIDASAGTGKTYAICSLVLRLLLEKNLTIEQILVVTYTEAATEDLRGRIRQKLRQALHAVNHPPGDDAFLHEYLATIKDYPKAAQRLSEALRSFDAAAIFTIHGFCQRMLLENSFESNTLFDTELVTDDSYLIKEIVEDFWRRIFSQCSNLFSQYAADKITPDLLHDFLGPFMPHPFLRFIPAIEFATGCSNFSESEIEYNNAYSAVCNAWAGARKEVLQDLLYSQVLNRNMYKKAKLPALIGAMDAMAAANRPSPYLIEKFILLTSSKIAAGTKAKKTPQILPFYEYCEDLMQARNKLHARYDKCLLALKKRLFDSYRHELNLRKERDNVFSFDDLLRRLHKALSGAEGTSFARTIALKYPAALIDEFQDTDPLQFEIFKTIYDDRSLLFLIGDPKQAIYSFRGADIFTYMDAAAGSPLAHHTLGVNHRSTPALVKAINTFFCRSENPFVFDAISFQPVSAAQKNNPEQLTIDGHQEAPFILWYLDGGAKSSNDSPSRQSKNHRISKTAARRLIISRVATEVCRLLNLASEDRIRINKRKLLPADIAILVRNNDEARKMQRALLETQVASVLHSGADLFASEEAKEMLLLLSAIATPGNLRKIKTGLLTRFIGLKADTINLLQRNSSANGKGIEFWLTKCRTYHDLWNRYGFIQMFWAVMQENRVRQRLLASENGERSLTNILHLAEILHHEAVSQGFNITALLGYMQDRLADKQTKNIEHQLRLESDEDRVKIVTIHKAKGLEYSVVFCPFTWEGTRLNPKKGCLFHQQKNGEKTELVFDAGSTELDSHLQMALQEELAENIRLLYVALTRAVHRCYLIWGPINGAETSAPAYLLHHGLSKTEWPENAEPLQDNFRQRVADRFAGLSDHEILAELQELAAAAGGTIKISTGEDLPATNLLDPKDSLLSLQYRKFAGSITRDWGISSFSSLTAKRSAFMQANQPLHDLVPDRDAVSPPLIISEKQTDGEDNRYDIYSFPYGARSGTLLHELLEQADFCNEQPVAEHLIYEKLHYFGYKTTWYPAIKQMLANLGNVRLHIDIPALKLCNIPPASCLHELEFYFPLARLSPDDVKHIFRTNVFNGSAENSKLFAKQLDRLTFAPSRGFMRGFIDLVFEYQGKFYLTDWKSNYLGSHIENYRQEKLLESILSGYYFLQYHIYTLALHLYLEKRLPGYQYENHFGGVFYVYLRGLDQNLGPDYGIYYDLPSFSVIERLSEKLLPGRTT
jgi:exodeoxyribonuclease V beta subunit